VMMTAGRRRATPRALAAAETAAARALSGEGHGGYPFASS